MEAHVIDYTTETGHPNKGENAKQRWIIKKIE